MSLIQLPSLVNSSTQLLLDKRLNVHPIRFEQAFLNLLTYSLQSIGTQGTIKVRSMRVENTAVIEVFNSSTKQSEEEIISAFSPFSQTNKGNTAGLGLPIAKSIVERHGGQLVVLTQQEGTKFVIQLPC